MFEHAPGSMLGDFKRLDKMADSNSLTSGQIIVSFPESVVCLKRYEHLTKMFET